MHPAPLINCQHVAICLVTANDLPAPRPVLSRKPRREDKAFDLTIESAAYGTFSPSTPDDSSEHATMKNGKKKGDEPDASMGGQTLFNLLRVDPGYFFMRSCSP